MRLKSINKYLLSCQVKTKLRKEPLNWNVVYNNCCEKVNTLKNDEKLTKILKIANNFIIIIKKSYAIPDKN